MSLLLSPITICKTEFRNKVFISPMCQYSAENGVPNDWHFVHLGSFAVGGAGLVMAEATAVEDIGRISPGDTGIWNDSQTEAFSRITKFIKAQGAVPAIQLAHAGRKGSTDLGWKKGKQLTEAEGAWQTVAPSALAFSSKVATPRELALNEIATLNMAFKNSAQRSLQAGFEVIELHMAHGYLMHQFLSPLSNKRADQYGGSFENRVRFPLEVTKSVRQVWPESKPLFVRLSVTDWVEGGWDQEQSIELSRLLKKEGVDLIDCSSGGSSPDAKIPTGPGYQVSFSKAIRMATGMKTGAVGMITEAEQAEAILKNNEADVVFIAREALRSPRWPLLAAAVLKENIAWPKQYERAQLPI